jgi:hypothetical protein
MTIVFLESFLYVGEIDSSEISQKEANFNPFEHLAPNEKHIASVSLVQP